MGPSRVKGLTSEPAPDKPRGETGAHGSTRRREETTMLPNRRAKWVSLSVGIAVLAADPWHHQELDLGKEVFVTFPPSGTLVIPA